MKSYFLENIDKSALLENSLNELLPGQSNPWLITINGDVAGYVNIELENKKDSLCSVTVDISGRHFNCDQEIINFLNVLKELVGGIIKNDV